MALKNFSRIGKRFKIAETLFLSRKHEFIFKEDWVLFYSFDFSAAEKINAPATSSSDIESQPESTTSMGSGTETDNKASITSGTNDDSTDTSDIIDPEEKNTNLIAITLIAVATIAAVIVVVAMIKVAKSNKTD